MPICSPSATRINRLANGSASHYRLAGAAVVAASSNLFEQRAVENCFRAWEVADSAKGRRDSDRVLIERVVRLVHECSPKHSFVLIVGPADVAGSIECFLVMRFTGDRAMCSARQLDQREKHFLRLLPEQSHAYLCVK
jgi:hypothetical protein